MAKTSYEYGAPLPKTIGRCADAFKEVQELRLAMQKEVDVIKKRESELGDHILETLSASDDTGASGLKYKAQVKSSVKATVTDWDAVHGYVYDNDRFDLMAKSVNQKAVMEIFEAGEKVPGIEKINVKKVSITKIA